MLKGKPAQRRSANPSKGQGVTRRKFLRDLTVLGVSAVTGSALLEGCSTPPPPTPTSSVPPEPTQTMVICIPSPAKSTPVAATQTVSVMDALRKRQSASGFQAQALPKETLMELLWAAWGINRPDSGKRTAPSAMNAQEIDLYVLLAEGAFIYDAKGNQLTSIVTEDLRAQAVTSGTLRDAPVQLVFVADYARLRTGSDTQRQVWSAAHSGFIGQNVYLYCASQGLGARFYAGINSAALKTVLKLRTDQAVLFGQAVGYPKA